jgi:hypothetical protein
LVKLGQHKQLKEIDLTGKLNCLQIRADHYFGISVISLSLEDALLLRDEIDEWIREEETISSRSTLAE